jgi:hypothetical protein
MEGWQEVKTPGGKSEEELAQERLAQAQENRVEFEVEGEAAPEKTKKLVKKPVEAAEDDSDIEIEDDTPEADRGKRRSASTGTDLEVSEEELEGYSDRVKKRISQMAGRFHDERRVKEQALRERQAAEVFAQAQLKRTKELEQQLEQFRNSAQTATKSQLETELAVARKAYKEAYDAGDSDALEQANDKVIDLRMKLAESARAPEVKETPLQEEQDPVYSNQRQPAQAAPAVDPKAVEWSAENPWFGANSRMTNFAKDLHIELVLEKKVDPTSEEYYNTINKRVRQAFPDYDWAQDDLNGDAPEPVETHRAEKKPATVVAGASRSTPARKVKLTQSQVAIARRLGVSLEDYARQVADLNNGDR